MKSPKIISNNIYKITILGVNKKKHVQLSNKLLIKNTTNFKCRQRSDVSALPLYFNCYQIIVVWLSKGWYLIWYSLITQGVGSLCYSYVNDMCQWYGKVASIRLSRTAAITIMFTWMLLFFMGAVNNNVAMDWTASYCVYLVISSWGSPTNVNKIEDRIKILQLQA